MSALRELSVCVAARYALASNNQVIWIVFLPRRKLTVRATSSFQARGWLRDYSWRKAAKGSIRAALRAGSRQASKATAIRSSESRANTAGSVGVTPKSI